MTISPFYPAKPWPVADLQYHPAFKLLMKEQKIGKLQNPPVFYELLRVAQNPEKYQDGVSLYDFLDECSTRDSGEGSILELIRMNVFRMEYEPECRLVTCEKIEEEKEKRNGRKQAGFYMDVKILEAIKINAAATHTSMSRFVELAVAAYLGIPAEAPV